MDLQKAFNVLYDVMALDKTIKKEILKDAVQDEGVCFLLSLGQHYSISNLTITRGGTTSNLKFQVSNILVNPKRFWGDLGMKEQVVLKELLSNNNTFDSTIFYGHGVKVFTKAEVSRKIHDRDTSDFPIAYLIVDSPKYYYKTRTKKIWNSTVPRGLDIVEPKNFETVLVDANGDSLATGTAELGFYLKDGGDILRFAEPKGNFKFSNSVANIQAKVNQYKDDKYALVFHEDGIVTLSKGLIKKTYGIIDLLINDDFEVVGVWFKVTNDYYHMLNCNVPQTVIDNGIDAYTVRVECNELKNGDINNIRFIQFNKKEIK